MVAPLVAALIAGLAAQAVPTDDVATRMRAAQLHARQGQSALAEDEYRALLRDRPTDIDVRVGLAGVILRRNAWREALTLLTEVEAAASENADVFAVRARTAARVTIGAHWSTTRARRGSHQPTPTCTTHTKTWSSSTATRSTSKAARVSELGATHADDRSLGGM
jgi:predicted Zn-dependent protease